ncbi:hypothetical protein GDO81_023130 [Engystomops pustulosus]|uniref:Uncharacterized protein n=1 Tax=Engystomops pustulosus TaxID=76066 RepID=A0AAV6YSL9_ENGPU|nr:hypothetical protein GDO81_023130 [Engystomops pustulosus]
MGCQLVKLVLILMSLVCALSMVTPTTPTLEMETTNESLSETSLSDNSTEKQATDGEAKATSQNLVALAQEEASNVTNPTTKVAASTDTKGTQEQVTEPSRAVTKEEVSTEDPVTTNPTKSKEPSSPTFPGITVPANLPVTDHEHNQTADHEMTPSPIPSNQTMVVPKLVTTKAPKHAPMTTSKPKTSYGDIQKIKIIIGVLIVILVLVLITVVVVMVRNKRRSGSQSFHSQKRSSKKQDVWAGQAPELGDGKMTRHPEGMENGTGGNKPQPGQEQEMITFTSAEKKDESVAEVNELEEKKPLLEDGGEDEAEKPPAEEQIPALTMEQEKV